MQILIVACGPLLFWGLYSDYRRGLRLQISGYWSDRVNNPGGFLVAVTMCVVSAMLWIFSMCYVFGMLRLG
jgi:hypothetical protein